MRLARLLLWWLPAALLILAAALLWNEHATLAITEARMDALRDAQSQRNARHAEETARLEERNRQLEARLHDLEMAQAHGQQEVRDWEGKLRAADARDQELEARLQAAEHMLADAKGGGNAAAANASDRNAVALETARVRRQVANRYGALAQKLGLTPGQTDQFMKLLIDKQLAARDLLESGVKEGANTMGDPEGFADLVASQQNDIENQIQALLGDTGYSQYLQWGLTSGQSNTVARLQAALNGTEPLTDTQAAQLLQLLQDNRIGHFTAKIVATAQAQGILSPTQYQALLNLYQQQQAAQQARHLPAAPAGGK